MESVELKIGDANLPQFEPINPTKIHYDIWGDAFKDDEFLPYDTEITEAVPSEIDICHTWNIWMNTSVPKLSSQA